MHKNRENDLYYFIRFIFPLFLAYYFQVRIMNFSDDINIICLIKILPQQIQVQQKITFIPQNNFISKTTINCDIPKPEYDLIRFIDYPEAYEGLPGFYVVTKGNPDFHSGFYDTIQDDLNYQTWHHNATILHLKNVYTTYSSAIVTKDFSFIQIDKNEFCRKYENGNIIGSYDVVIALGNTQLICFSHFIYDVLSPLNLFPEDLLKSAHILIYTSIPASLEPLQLFGIQPSQYINITKMQWIYANELYTTMPQPHVLHFGALFAKLSTRLRQFYGVDNITPTVYAVTNRKKGLHRHIRNLDAILPTLKSTFPKYNLQYYEDIFTLREIAHTWCTFKFVFAPTGSNCVKNVFMKEKSVLVVILGSVTDNSICLSAGSHGVYTLYGIIKGMPHWGYGRSMIDINLATRLFDIGLYCSDHGHWKENETFKSKLETN